MAGRGGMGVVYRATQLALDRTVALKVIAPGLLDDQTMRNRFVRESKVAASIDHPNVIPIYYAGEEDGIAYLAMRYVAGDDVRSLVRREGALPAERAARIAAQIGSALDAAHGAGLVHRDIKPANVLLTAEDHVYLTDFGLTKHALSVGGSTRPGHWVGTLDYVAPEQIRGDRIDARADVYAFGCLLSTCSPARCRSGATATRRGCGRTSPSRRRSRASAYGLRPPSTTSSRARSRRIPTSATRPPATWPSRRRRRRGRRRHERERLVAKGAAAPIESETVTAAARPPQATMTQPQLEAETVRADSAQARASRRTARRRAARRRRGRRGRCRRVRRGR